MGQVHPDPEAAVFNLPTEGYWLPSANEFALTLPNGLREKVQSIVSAYILAYWDGARDRLNGRTVAQVISEFEPPPGLPVVAEGDRDGVRYTLYDAPPADERDD